MKLRHQSIFTAFSRQRIIYIKLKYAIRFLKIFCSFFQLLFRKFIISVNYNYKDKENTLITYTSANVGL